MLLQESSEPYPLPGISMQGTNSGDSTVWVLQAAASVPLGNSDPLPAGWADTIHH